MSDTATLTGFFADVESAATTLLPDAAVTLSPDREALALLLASIRRARKQLADADQFIEDELTKIMGARFIEVTGLGRVEMHSGASRKGWDHDGIRQAITRVIADTAVPAVLVDPEEGIELKALDVVRTIVGEWVKLGNPSYRTGGGPKPGLRTFGVDPDEYCSTTWGRKTIETPALPDSTADQDEKKDT